MTIAKIEVVCPYCNKAHIHQLEYGDPTTVIEAVDDGREDQDNGPD